MDGGMMKEVKGQTVGADCGKGEREEQQTTSEKREECEIKRQWRIERRKEGK